MKHSGREQSSHIFLKEICTVTHSLVSCGEAISKCSVGTWMGKKYLIGDVCLFIENRDYSYRYTWMTLKRSGKEQKMAPTRKQLMNNVDLDEPTSFLHHGYLGCTQRECKAIDECRDMFESPISAARQLKICQGGEKPHANGGCVALRRCGRTCSKVRGVMLRTGRTTRERAVVQSFKSFA